MKKTKTCKKYKSNVQEPRPTARPKEVPQFSNRGSQLFRFYLNTISSLFENIIPIRY